MAFLIKENRMQEYFIGFENSDDIIIVKYDEYTAFSDARYAIAEIEKLSDTWIKYDDLLKKPIEEMTDEERKKEGDEIIGLMNEVELQIGSAYAKLFGKEPYDKLLEKFGGNVPRMLASTELLIKDFLDTIKNYSNAVGVDNTSKYVE